MLLDWNMQKNFPGHQILVATHTDGNNNSGTIHVHIVLNSLRKYDVPVQPFMKRDCDHKAGYKYHQTNQLLQYLKMDLMELCEREGLSHTISSCLLTGVTEPLIGSVH